MSSALAAGIAADVQGGMQFDLVRNPTCLRHLLERGPDPLNFAVDPREIRHNPLMMEANPLQGENKNENP
jgi:hypothetical protein